MSREHRREMLLANIYVIFAGYPHTRAATVPSSSNSGRRGIIVKCTPKRANCNRAIHNVPRRGGAAAAVGEEDAVEAVEARRPQRHKFRILVRPLPRMEYSTHPSRPSTHQDRTRGGHGCIRCKAFSSRRGCRRCKTWFTNIRWQTCRPRQPLMPWCRMTLRRWRSTQAATCRLEDSRQSHRISQRSTSHAHTAIRNFLRLVPSTDTPKWLTLNNGAQQVEDKAVRQDNDPSHVKFTGTRPALAYGSYYVSTQQRIRSFSSQFTYSASTAVTSV